jgi:hypothetical protein
MFVTPATIFCSGCFSCIRTVIHFLMILIGCTAIALPAWAQESKTTQSVILNPINITATRSERSPEQIPNSVTQITRYPQQNFQPGATLDEFARGTPGVFFQNQFNFTQDLRIAIRGFWRAFAVRGARYSDARRRHSGDVAGRADAIGFDRSVVDRAHGYSARAFRVALWQRFRRHDRHHHARSAAGEIRDHAAPGVRAIRLPEVRIVYGRTARKLWLQFVWFAPATGWLARS